MNRLIIENPPPITDNFTFRSQVPYSYGVLDSGDNFGGSSVSSGGETPSSIGKIIEAGGKVVNAGTKLLDKDKSPIEKPESITPQNNTSSAKPFEQIDTNLSGEPLKPGNDGLLTDPNAGNLSSDTLDPSSMGGVADDIVNQPSSGGVLSNTQTPVPDNLLNGDNGVLDTNITADPYANVDTNGALGPNDLPSIPTTTSPLHLFDTGTNFTDTAGAVTLPEGATQMADGSMVLADGTTIGADGTVTDAAGKVLTGAQANGVISGALKWGGAAAGALGFGMSAYDLAKNGVSPENFGGMMTGGLAAASPWLAGAGPAAAVIAIPFAFKSIFGHKHKAPTFNDNVEDITPFKKDNDGNIYMKMPGHASNIFRYNPTTNKYQVEGHRGGEDVGMGGDNMTTPTYGGHWEDLPVYEHNGQYYLRPSGGTWDDFYNISPISEYTQASVTPNDNLDNIYNSYIDASRTQQEADKLWDNRTSTLDLFNQSDNSAYLI